MKRSELEHILRASKGITGETEFIVFGSQAILGRFPDAPRELRQSWEQRLIRLSSENTAGLEPHDLAFSKLAARREKISPMCAPYFVTACSNERSWFGASNRRQMKSCPSD